MIGPESTGKSTLCEQLAAYYHTEWVPEFARQYISGLPRRYTKEDVAFCAQKQLELENEKSKTARIFLFCDTEFIVFKVWFEDVFNCSPAWISALASEKRYDLYLLTRPDIIFVDDPVRENPHRRQFFFDWYKSLLDEFNFTYRIIEGDGNIRIQLAIKFIEEQFSK